MVDTMRSVVALASSVVLLAPPQARDTSAPWIESKSAHYSVFYQAGFEKDVEFARTWADRAERLMKDKYGVTPVHYWMSIYLHPAPNAVATVDNARNKCCTPDGAVNRGSIDLLAPSAPIWRDSRALSSLGLPKNDESYHAKILMSEYIPIGHWETQATRPDGGWKYYSAPNWFVQGLQEYDAIFHTTTTNRDVAGKRLFAWAAEHAGAFQCCEAGLNITDAYNGGAAFMAFLAATFGENVHASLLRDTAPTFDAALADVTRPYSRAQLFEKFLDWLKHAAQVPGRGGPGSSPLQILGPNTKPTAARP